MHPILQEFLEQWVWPTALAGPGVTFRYRITEQKCIPAWERSLLAVLKSLEKELAKGDGQAAVERALTSYSIEGIQASIKQLSTPLLTVAIDEQERYIDLQRIRARQLWDECKHSKLHVDVLLGKGFAQSERELMHNPRANAQPLNAYFGCINMLPYIHPLARAASNYLSEARAVLGIVAHLSLIDDPLDRHQELSQRDEERMHFMEGKYQIEVHCTTPETQQIVEETLDWLLHSDSRRQLSAIDTGQRGE